MPPTTFENDLATKIVDICKIASKITNHKGNPLPYNEHNLQAALIDCGSKHHNHLVGNYACSQKTIGKVNHAITGYISEMETKFSICPNNDIFRQLTYTDASINNSTNPNAIITWNDFWDDPNCIKLSPPPPLSNYPANKKFNFTYDAVFQDIKEINIVEMKYQWGGLSWMYSSGNKTHHTHRFSRKL